MTSFLFWNLNRRALTRQVANLAWRRDVDVLMLAECGATPGQMLMALNREQTRYEYAGSNCERILMFTRFSNRLVAPTREQDRYTIRRLTLPGAPDALLAVAHLPSKAHWGDRSQAYGCEPLIDDIRACEQQARHARTILVGDLNMHPFEEGVVSARRLHGVMSRDVAQRGSRVVQGEAYRFFYNPMWSLMGDATPGPPGTYYQSRAEHVAYFWSMFDQVLIRPELLPCFDNRSLAILTDDGESSLLTSAGYPDTRRASDHLPIYFELALQNAQNEEAAHG